MCRMSRAGTFIMLAIQHRWYIGRDVLARLHLDCSRGEAESPVGVGTDLVVTPRCPAWQNHLLDP